MERVLIIGGGIIGATIAHELSLISGLQITVFDPDPTANATHGALGVLMGVISRKMKGRAWRRRLYSLNRYDRLIDQLEVDLGERLPYNREGLIMACRDASAWDGWQQLQACREAQGLPLVLLQGEALWEQYPQFSSAPGLIYGAIASPCDRQLHPVRISEALLAMARRRGVEVVGQRVRGLEFEGDSRCVRETSAVAEGLHQRVVGVVTDEARYQADWVVVAAGLGSAGLLPGQVPPLRLRPVLGQGIEVALDRRLGVGLEPVLTGDDVHVVPLDAALDSEALGGRYWVGATVELPEGDGVAVASADRLEEMWGRAVELVPGLAGGCWLRCWSGLRPRPEGQPAPVIGRSGNVITATGHYRNGVLLAPVTAREVIELMGLELPIELRLD